MGRQARLKAVRRAEREQPPEQAGRFPRQRQLLVGGAMLVVFGAVLAAALLVGRGSGAEGASPTGLPRAASSPPADGNGEVGSPFPSFSLVEAGGRTLTRASLRGKPAIIWFTTSYCVPCQVGARTISRFDDELGGKRFDVLVVFVDPNESPTALTAWRDRYGSEDWLVTLDEDLALANRIGLRALDTKFLLDERGIVRNVDYTVADDRYVGVLRKIVGE